MAKASFQFLSASSVLKLDRLVSRQALPDHISPEIRDPSQIDQDTNTATDDGDDALCYIFVSHRWENPGDPDTSGKQLRALQGWLRMVHDLFCRLCLRPPLETTFATGTDEPNETIAWPLDLKNMVEGMPQAASLLARLRNRFLKKVQMYPHLKHQNPLDKIFVWYDCACLPQKFPRGRTQDESVEFYHALESLDALVRDCNVMLCLRSKDDDYEHRAWCSLECFVNSQMEFESELTLNCDAFLEREVVDWHLDKEEGMGRGDDTSSKRSNDNNDAPQDKFNLETFKAAILSRQDATLGKVDKVMRESRETSFNLTQDRWNEVVQNKHRLKEDVMLRVPDLVDAKLRIRRSRRMSPQDPPFQQALGHVVRELQWSVFCMSCQDAETSLNRNVHSYRMKCPDGVGLQCGLHNNNTGKSALQEAEEQERLESLVEAATTKYGFGASQPSSEQCLKCPQGHSLVPNVAASVLSCSSPECSQSNKISPGEVHTMCPVCDQDLCFQCSRAKAETTIHADRTSNPSSQHALQQLMQACGVSFPQTITSDPDDNASKERLCERLVCIDLHQLICSLLAKHNQRCTNAGDIAFVGLLGLKNFLNPQGKSENLQKKLHLSAGLLKYLRDMVGAAVQEMSRRMSEGDHNTTLRVVIRIKAPRWFFLDTANASFGLKAQLLNNEGLMIGKVATQYLEENLNSITYEFDQEARPLAQNFCNHNGCHAVWAPCQHKVEKRILTYAGTVLKSSTTLDPWSSVELPSTLAQFRTVVVKDCLFVIGGAPGGFDPATGAYTECVSSVCKTKVIKGNEEGSTLERWSSCPDLMTARCNFAACVIPDENGAPETILVAGGFGSTVAGVKAPRLSSSEILELNEDAASWKEGPRMPIGKTAHHMFACKGSIFVFGGRGEDGVSDQICDIFNLKRKTWLEGPELPLSIRGGGSVVVRNQYAVFFGGVSGNDILDSTWVLDAKPWAEWSDNGGDGAQRPSSGWLPGPALPVPAAAANICLAPASETGFDNDWILSVAPFELGNVCMGICVPEDAGSIDWPQLKWKLLGGAPAPTALGVSAMVQGTLFLIGGHHTDFGSYPSNKVFFRQWDQPNSLFSKPISCPEPGVLAANLALDAAHVGLNDCFLMGRLGFPLPEEKLFVPDGTKKLILLPAPQKGDFHCQGCLVARRDLNLSRSKGVVMYGLKKNKASRRISFCSRCICSL